MKTGPLKGSWGVRIGLLVLIAGWTVIGVGKLRRLDGDIDRLLTVGAGALAIVTIFTLSLCGVVWVIKRRFDVLGARLSRPFLVAMHDRNDGMDRLLHADVPHNIPPIPGISWTNDAIELWRSPSDTGPIAIVPKATIQTARIDHMSAVIPRPAIRLQINGVTQPVFLVLYGTSALDVIPLSSTRLRAIAGQLGLTLSEGENAADAS